MPLYDFECRGCGNEFEALVLKKEPVCPKCGSNDLERLLSLPVVRSEGTKQRTLANSRKRDQAIGAEREHAQREYEKNHDD